MTIQNFRRMGGSPWSAPVFGRSNVNGPARRRFSGVFENALLAAVEDDRTPPVAVKMHFASFGLADGTWLDFCLQRISMACLDETALNK
jgi:hypothetical protein